MSDSNELILRYQYESYMECGSPEKTYQLMGEGFTNLKESKNPKEYARKYINHITESTDVIGYSPSMDYSVDAIKNDPVIAELMAVTDNEMLGSDTHKKICCVDTWSDPTGKKCKATERIWAVIPSDKADGTDAMMYAGTLKAVSDIVHGTFDRETKIFTPDPPAVPGA